MEKINVFVETIYQNVEGNKKEIEDLKMEMRAHLLETVYELKAAGKSEQEAIDLAMKRFGGEKEMRFAITEMFKVQGVFAKWVLYLAVGFLIINFSIFGLILWNENNNMDELSSITEQISEKLNEAGTITPDIQKEVESIVERTGYLTEVSIYKSIGFDESQTPDYEYKRTIWSPKWMGAESFLYGNGNEQWFIKMMYRTFDTLLVVMLFAGLSIYWTLFSIWAIINAYQQRRLKISWIITFILLNVMGYLIYRYSSYLSNWKRTKSHLEPI